MASGRAHWCERLCNIRSTVRGQPALFGLAILLWIVPFGQGAAQTDERSEILPSRPPFIAASYLIVPEADFESAPSESEVDTKETRISAGLYGSGSNSFRWDIGLDYQYTRYEYAGINGRNRDLHWLQLPFGFTAKQGDWLIDGHLAPGVFTSSNVMKDLFDKGSSDDFGVAGRVEALRAAANGRQWLLGIAYDRSFGEPTLYPLAGIVLWPRDDMQLRLAFPETELRYPASERQTWTAGLFPSGNEWHVVSEELDDEFDYGIEAWRAQAWWSYRIWRKMFVDFSVGYEFARHFDFIDDTGVRIDTDADDQYFFSLGLRIGPGRIARGQRVSR